MAITTNPEFIAAVEFAKALAIGNGKKELTIPLMLGGFNLLLLNSENKQDLPEELLKRAEAIKHSCRLVRMPEDIDLDLARSIKLPISKPLKDLIGKKDQSIATFVDSLIDSNVLISQEDEVAFDKALMRASSWFRKQKNGAVVRPEVLGAAAYVCFLEGDVRDNPELATHILLSRESIKALISAEGWKESDFNQDGGCSIELPMSLLDSLDSNETSRVFAAVDMAADQGLRILKEAQTAIHEAGHAVAAFLLRPEIPISQVSIIGVDDFSGRTSLDRTSSARNSGSRTFYENELQILLAGAVAEQIHYGDGAIDRGAISDIITATKYVWNCVGYYGLDEEFGPVSIQALTEADGYSAGYLSDQAQKRSQVLLKDAKSSVRNLLTKNWRYVEEIANTLVDRKVIGTREVIEIFVDKKILDWPGVLSVQSLPTQRNVSFAEGPGICETLEGPVRYDKGDAIVTGNDGEQWPVSYVEFEARYKPIAGGKFGKDGLYEKVSRRALAVQLTDSKSVILSGSRGVLRGNKGDWIVDYGNQDLSVIQERLFETYYKVIASRSK
jgi:hypothetical protein